MDMEAIMIDMVQWCMHAHPVDGDDETRVASKADHISKINNV